MLYLYHNNSSVCAAKVRIVLAEKNLTWEGKLLDLNGGDQFKPDYVKLNPKSVVPTLIHDDRVTVEPGSSRRRLRSGRPPMVLVAFS